MITWSGRICRSIAPIHRRTWINRLTHISIMKTDSLFSRLFQQAPMLVFELAGMETPAAGG